MKMRKAAKKSSKKFQKSNFEEKFSLMVAEYNKAKEILDTLAEGTPEHTKQKNNCDRLFASAERLINAN